MSEIQIILILIAIIMCCTSSIISGYYYSSKDSNLFKDATSGLISGVSEGIKSVGDLINEPLNKCKTKYSEIIKDGETVIVDSGNCYVCPKERSSRTIFDIKGNKGCEGNVDSLKKNKESLAHDPLAAVVFSCPDKTTRNLDSVNSNFPCSGTCSSVYGKDSFEHVLTGDCYTCKDGTRNANLANSKKECSRKCEKGYSEDPNGSCFKCPKGTIRTMHPVTSDNACANDFLGISNPKKAIFGKPSVYSWTKNGSKKVPLKVKLSVFGKAKYLGPFA